MRMDTHELAAVIGGTTAGLESRLVTGYSTDTRTIRKGDAFFAIPGATYNGADFVAVAMEKGASCCITNRFAPVPGIILVEDVIRSMGILARHVRGLMNIPFIAITGSLGKTTTKDMISSVLSKKYRVHATQGNLNNHIGLPLTLLCLEKTHQISVMEMGMNAPGEIDYLSSLVRPDIGILTNIGTSHIGRLGSVEGIFRAKTEMLNHLREGGILLVNGDDPMLSRLKGNARFQVMTFGLASNHTIRGEHVRADNLGIHSFTVGEVSVELPIPGKHMIYNVLPAVFLGMHFGLRPEEITEGIRTCPLNHMRMEIIRRDGYLVINDSYNAAPHSMKAAIDVLCFQRGRSIAVLGDMLELGEFTEASHEEVGQYAREKQVGLLVACGHNGEFYAKGMGADQTIVFSHPREAGTYLRNIVKPGDAILVKGSRGMAMELVMEYI